MGATNTNVAAVAVVPIGGSSSSGAKLGLIDSVAKAAQNDTFTVTNGTTYFQVLSIIDDTTGAFETHTVSSNVVTMTSATTGAKTALVLFK